ncbi:MAG: SRPBCC family protein [Chitinophagales bacterium]
MLIIILVVLLAIVAVFAVFVPTKLSISSSTIINAPKEIVWSNVTFFKNIQQWSPWAKRDPNIKITLEGTDGTEGAKSSWDGNDRVGAGSQTFTKLDPMNRAEEHLQFIRPFKSEADAFMQLSDTAGAVKVTWGFSTSLPRPFNVMSLFMSNKSVQSDYEEGLANLKAICEQQALQNKTYRGFKISEVDQPMLTYVGKRETVSIMSISKFFASQMQKMMPEVHRAQLEIAGAPSGLYYTFDTVKMTTDMAVGIPVKELKTPLDGWETINVPSGKALEIDYYGSYSKIGSAYAAFSDCTKDKELTPKSFVIEEYITDPMTEKDTAKWLTKIYYYVQ